jgi:hypothetical protein
MTGKRKVDVVAVGNHAYCRGGKYCSQVVSAPANIYVLNVVFAWLIVP